MIAQAATEIFDQGLSLLNEITDEDYNVKMPLVYNGTIGGHYRHILEHFISLIEHYDKGFVNYDLRNRNPKIENERSAAIQATNDLKRRWKELCPSHYDKPLELNGKLSYEIESPMKLQTTLGREVAYSIAHAHHHYAIIGIMCKVLECPTNDAFGIAPSTVKHNQQSAQPVPAAH